VDELAQRMLGDGAYDSDPLDARLAKRGIEMIELETSSTQRPAQELRARDRSSPPYPRPERSVEKFGVGKSVIGDILISSGRVLTIFGALSVSGVAVDARGTPRFRRGRTR